MAEWFEDEGFWRDLYLFLFPEERFEAAGEEVDKILELAGAGGGSVLDLACGPGRHAVALAGRGHRVTGVDRSPFLLEKARAHARGAGVEVEWVRSDMRDFVRPGAFDLVLNLFSSFGYFETEDEDLEVLRNVHRSLAPGGACVIDALGKEWLARNLQPTLAHELSDGSLLVERPEIVADWTRVRNRWFHVVGDRVRTFRFELTIYSGRELKDLLSRAGFADVRLYGDLDGGGYGFEAQRLIAVARKETGSGSPRS